MTPGLLVFSLLLIPLLATAGESAAEVDALIEAGHWKRVRGIAEAQVKSDANNAQAHFWLAKVLPGFNDFDSALAHAEKAVALAGNNAAYHGQLAEVCALIADRSSAVKGFTFVRRMRKEIDAALAINARHTDTLLVDMMFSFKAPGIAGGDRKKAFQIADRIQSISPEWGYLAHARLLQDGTDDKTTEQMLLNAVKASPSFYRARASLARFYCCTAQQKRPDRAESAALQAVSADPAATPAYEVLARIYAQQERWAELDKLLQRAEHAVPDDFAPYYAAAQGCFDVGKDFERGRSYLTRYLGQPVEGRQPTHAEGRWLLARMYEKEGRRADAVRELEMAVRQDPLLDGAKKDLKRLRHG
ncbi:MAG: hypothetical protein SGI92_05170 [Bryobacteraceae bacterium]|nr:hypothetical protein [Bryobacteraceae bacterium]